MARCQMQFSAGNVTNNTTNNNTNTTNNTTNMNNCSDNRVTNNVVINYNSYDKPDVSHVTLDTVKKMYFAQKRNLKKIIHAAVCEIWKVPENNSFSLPFKKSAKEATMTMFRENQPLSVFVDGDTKLLPIDHVVDVLLHKSAAVYESYLRMHHTDETIIGTGVLKHADALEDLAIEFQEMWDLDKANRSTYKPFVKTALLECLRDKEDRENAVPTRSR